MSTTKGEEEKEEEKQEEKIRNNMMTINPPAHLHVRQTASVAHIGYKYFHVREGRFIRRQVTLVARWCIEAHDDGRDSALPCPELCIEAAIDKRRLRK